MQHAGVMSDCGCETQPCVGFPLCYPMPHRQVQSAPTQPGQLASQHVATTDHRQCMYTSYNHVCLTPGKCIWLATTYLEGTVPVSTASVLCSFCYIYAVDQSAMLCDSNIDTDSLVAYSEPATHKQCCQRDRGPGASNTVRMSNCHISQRREIVLCWGKKSHIQAHQAPVVSCRAIAAPAATGELGHSSTMHTRLIRSSYTALCISCTRHVGRFKLPERNTFAHRRNTCAPISPNSIDR